MAEPVEPLIADLLEWVGTGRAYSEVMEAWRTSCPRLPVWEEANLRGYLDCCRGADGARHVVVTREGADHLRAVRRLARP